MNYGCIRVHSMFSLQLKGLTTEWPSQQSICIAVTDQVFGKEDLNIINTSEIMIILILH